MSDAVGGGPLAVLIGPPGAGKTTTARAIAARLGAPTFDTDDAVEARSGSSISDLFLDHGEAHFRALEREAVAAALRESTGILSLGGGAVLDPRTQADLRLLVADRVVFLEVTIADAARRVGFDQSRPLLNVNPRASWTALMKVRRPIYASLATATVDTSGRTPDDVADEVIAALGLGS